MSDAVFNLVIVEYDPRWPHLYDQERARVLAALGEAVDSVEHIGSTSVPGLPAKKIIDILVTVARLGAPEAYAERLASLGYTYFPELGNADRQAFGKGTPHTHHIHIVQHGGEEHVRPIVFRDYLRAHPEAALRYAALKRELATCFHDDRRAYSAGKTAFVRSIEASARG
jgi:GrpB-like predicted nucleotidyltransferase (UPF0157 family)